MKSTSLPRIVLLGCVLGVASVTAASAQETTTNTPPPSGNQWGYHHHHGSVLTPAEWTELKTDREQVFAANPALKSQGESLRAQGKSLKGASSADKQAFHQQWEAYEDQVNEAIVQYDSNAAPIIAKLKAAFHEHHHHPSDSSSDTGLPPVNSGS